MERCSIATETSAGAEELCLKRSSEGPQAVEIEDHPNRNAQNRRGKCDSFYSYAMLTAVALCYVFVVFAPDIAQQLVISSTTFTSSATTRYFSAFNSGNSVSIKMIQV